MVRLRAQEAKSSEVICCRRIRMLKRRASARLFILCLRFSLSLPTISCLVSDFFQNNRIPTRSVGTAPCVRPRSVISRHSGLGPLLSGIKLDVQSEHCSQRASAMYCRERLKIYRYVVTPAYRLWLLRRSTAYIHVSGRATAPCVALPPASLPAMTSLGDIPDSSGQDM